MKDTNNIVVTPQHSALVPRSIVESKLKVKPTQMDILIILLAEIGKPTDVDENLEYSITVSHYAELKKITEKAAARQLHDFVVGDNKTESMRHIGFELCLGNEVFEHYNWFSKITMFDQVATFYLTPDIKRVLVEFKQNDTYKVYAKLKYILPMQSQYSKRIYLMCREFISSGHRFCDTNWQLFRDKLQIPSTYKTTHIKKQILDVAVKELSEYSDITIAYHLKEEPIAGGKTPIAIQFDIFKKETEEDQIDNTNNKDVVDVESNVLQEIETLSSDELAKLEEQIAKIKLQRQSTEL